MSLASHAVKRLRDLQSSVFAGLESLEGRLMLSAAPQTLADLPVAAQNAISSAIGQDQSAYHATFAAAGVTLANPANSFIAQLLSGVLQVSAGSDTWDMSLEGIGYGGVVQPVGTAQISSNGNRVDLNYGTIDEWYVNGPVGLEQGFNVPPLPQSYATGALAVELCLGGDLTATVNAAGDGLTLSRPDGSVALGYTGLVAYDATGKALPASLEVRADGSHQDLLIYVNDADATGRITIDPWVQAKLTATDGAANDFFGSSVAISGNTLVVGTGPTNGPGAAYVFTKSGSNWVQTAKLTASDSAVGDAFGNSVSIDGNTVVVGAQMATVGGNSYQGAACVFTEPVLGWGSEPNMTQTAELTASDGRAYAMFGFSVSVDGNTVVVGACDGIGYDGEMPGPGSAYMFTEPVSGWGSEPNMTQTAELTASDGELGDYFGSAVSISGNTVVVGAPQANYDNGWQGAAYVFTKPDSGWTDNYQTAKLTASDGQSEDLFGTSVSISDNTVVVGATQYMNDREGPGAAYVFTEPVSGWGSEPNMTQNAKLTASDHHSSDLFGSSVSISGNTAVVGATNKGAAYVFTESGSKWGQTAESLGNYGFGSSVSISGNTVVVGAPYATVGGNIDQGAAYVATGTGPKVPTISGVSPNIGPLAGGTTVTITGTNLLGAKAVNFGAAPATIVSDKATQIVVRSPAEAAGTVDVKVVTAGGTSSTSSADKFTYVAGSFLLAGNCDTGAEPVMVVSGDFNHDGIRDLATVNDSSTLDPGSISILFGNGDGTFADKTDITTDVDPMALVVGDFNGDGIDDLAVANNESDTVDIFLSNGDGTFQDKMSFSTGDATGPQSLAVGDFNDDGNVDLAVGLGSADQVAVYLGDGSGGFSQTASLDVNGPTSIAVADFNGDGISDLAMVQQDSDSVRVVLGNDDGTGKGDGTFHDGDTYDTGGTPIAVAVGHFNKDNAADLAVTSYADETVSVLLGVGDGTFHDQVVFPTGLEPHGVAVGDLDLDGNSDLAIANWGDDTATVLLGDGAGGFQAVSPDLDVQSSPRSVVIDDFNGDGRQDLAVANAGSDSVSILLGIGPVASNFARTINEGATLKLAARDFTGAFADPGGATLQQVKIDSLPMHGTLKLMGVPVTVNQVIPASQLGGLTLALPVGFAGESQFGWQGYDGLYSTYADVAVWTTPKVSIVSNGNATEGGAGSNFTISLNVPALSDLTISLSASGKAKAGKNYTALPKTITIPAGQTSANVALATLVDRVAKGDLSVIAKIGNGKGYIAGSPNPATMMIVDDEPKVSITANPAGTSLGAAAGAVTFTRTGPTDAPLTFTITVKGTAKGGKDYTALPVTVTIGAQQSSTTVNIVPLVNVTKTKTVIVSAKATLAFSLDPLAFSALVSILP